MSNEIGMSKEFNERVTREQVRIAMRQLPTTHAASLAAALVLSYTVLDTVSRAMNLAWILIMLAITVARIMLCRRFCRVREEPFSGGYWRNLYLIQALGSGIAWGLSAFLIFPAGNQGLISLFVLVITSASATTTVSHSSIRLGPAAFAGPALALYDIRCLMEGGQFGYALGLLLFVYMVMIIRYSFNHNDTITSAIALRFENLELLKEAQEMNDALRQEIADRKLVEETLVRQTALHSGLLDSIPDIIFFKDREGVYLGCNPPFAAFVGRSREAIVGSTDYDLLSKEVADMFREHDRSMLEQGVPQSNEEWINHPDGRRVLVDTLRAPLRDSQGTLIGLLGVGRDVTERRLAEEELLMTQEMVDAMNRELGGAIDRANFLAAQAESANVAKSEFLANMSHEIRTPMNGVIGMTDVLLDTNLTDEQREYAGLIKKSGEALLSVINDILDFSKIEAGKLEVELIDFELSSTVDGLIDILAVRAYEKGLEFSCLVDPEVPVRVHGDPGRLRQILTNLVGNAVKFTHKGQVGLHITLDREDDTSALVRFAVTDSGIGIPEDKLGMLFQPFTQIDGSITRKFGGTGLGLSISRQLVEMMGGQIECESEEGKGSTFWFTVSLGKQETAGVGEEKPAPSLSDVRILAVDGNLANREVFAAMFESWKCRHEELADATLALERLREAATGGDPFSIAIVETQASEIDGETFGRTIKEDPALRDTKLVMMTSVGKRGDASRFEKAGFTAYLTKPIKRAQLHDCLVMVLERAESVEHPCGAIITRHSVVEGRKGEVRILLAEDNLTNRMVALKILEKLGYTADAVGNGLEVLDAVQALPYDLVLMDVQMPEMDGFEATQKIRNLESTASNRDLPIIAMTAHAMKGDRERCLEAGMSDYVTKPIRPRELGEAIARWTSPGKRINRDRPVEKRTDPTEVFDRAGLLDRLSGDEEMLQELMETFLDDIPRQIGTLEEAIEKGNALDARLHAHTLKGTSANFGAQTLQAAAYWVEKAAEGGSLSKALEGMERIKAEFDTFRQVVAPVNRSK